MEKIIPLLKEVFNESKINPNQLDQIAVTTFPGLLGPLLTGINVAKTIAWMWKKPILPVNHLLAHLEAIHLTSIVTYPYVGVLISGGHSLYLLMHSPTKHEILGTTLDDAAGEAFDKGGKIIGLGYPAGKQIDDLAKIGDANKYRFPIGLKDSKDANLSYSGVKTSLRFMVEKDPTLMNKDNLADLCASYQKAIIDALELKLSFALKKLPLKNLPIVVGGGVACNTELRTRFANKFPNVLFVAPKFCTDNGAMIANYGLRAFEKSISYPQCLEVDARGKYASVEELKHV
jgi:N6-L-threonylcarbamoyladenine synthase